MAYAAVLAGSDGGATTLRRGLEKPVLERLSTLASTQRFARHNTLFCEGEPAETLFELMRGVVKVSKLLGDGRRQIVGFLYPGHLLGLMVGRSYAYTAEALTDGELCRYPRASLDRLVEETPSLMRRLLALTADELRAAQDQMLLLGRKSAPERIASFLLMMGEHSGGGDGLADGVELPMGRLDIGDYLGLSMETVSRVLSQLRGAGLIALVGNQRVVFRDPEALQTLAEGDHAALAMPPSLTAVRGRAVWPI